MQGDFDDSEPNVDLSAFETFGDSGTPAGMIGSWQRSAAVGSCGIAWSEAASLPPPPPFGGGLPPAPLFGAPLPADAPLPPRAAIPDDAPWPELDPSPHDDDEYPWGPAPLELSASDIPVLRTPELTRATAAAVSNSGSWPALPREAPGETGDALDEDLHGAGLRARRGLRFALGVLVIAAVAAAAWWWTRPPPPPPPPPPPLVIVPASTVEPIDPSTQLGADPNAPRSNVEIQELTLGPQTVAGTAAHASRECRMIYAKTKAARDAGDWDVVDEGTRRPECWKKRDELREWRLKSLYERRRYAECVAFAERVRDETWRTRCATKL